MVTVLESRGYENISEVGKTMVTRWLLAKFKSEIFDVTLLNQQVINSNEEYQKSRKNRR
jgi:hypothetical protein